MPLVPRRLWLQPQCFRRPPRAPTTSASAGTSQSKDCPIAWGTRALRIGRSVGSAAARVREHTNHRSRAAEQPDEVAAFQLIELYFFPPAGAELQDIDLAASSQRVSKRLCNLVAVYEPRFSEPVCNYGGPGRTANSQLFPPHRCRRSAGSGFHCRPGGPPQAAAKGAAFRLTCYY